ncbi:MAG: IS1634 family transposase, partial [Longimicrobiales bacterium]|nr:IS1634 family transposase [Longimicrobiales bacterium]
HREGKHTRQRVLCTLGRVDELMASGGTDALLRSLARFGERVQVIDGYLNGDLEAVGMQEIGPDLAFGRLWQTTGIGAVLGGLLQERRFEFPVERAVYLTVLHRLFEPGSDRACDRWRRGLRVPGSEGVELHHLYRAMRWLGESTEAVEEALFHRRRDLFSRFTLAFFDTTSLYFEGQGGRALGQRGHSKDHRPDLVQMVVGAVLDDEGRPVSCPMWPGNQADVKSLMPVVDRMKERFGLQRVCWVADRGMIRRQTIEDLESRELEYILGTRMRRQKEVREDVLGRSGRYREVKDNLRVKEVWVEGRRYIVCHNPEEARKDAADREAILQSLEDKLKEGAGDLVGNRGYRRFLRTAKGAFTIDPRKVEADGRYDGKFVLRTNSALPADEVAVQYKRLLMVEQFFRAAKSMLDTRPIFHQWDATIKGHVFCSFLALILHDELKRHLARRGWDLEWNDVRRDLEALHEVAVRQGDETYLLRAVENRGICGAKDFKSPRNTIDFRKNCRTWVSRYLLQIRIYRLRFLADSCHQ